MADKKTKTTVEEENIPDTGVPEEDAKESKASFSAAAEAMGLDPAKISIPEHGDVAELEAEVETLRKQLEESNDKRLRAFAELENVRNRATRDIGNAHKYALQKFVDELLPVVDSLERGLESADATEDSHQAMREGIELTLTMLMKLLEKHSITAMNPLGETFDSDVHEAMSMQPTADAKPGTILAVIQKGYKLHDRVVRPARVVVAKEMTD